MVSYLNEESRVTHKRSNLYHSAVLIVGIGLLMSFSAWLLWGPAGILVAVAAVAVALAFGPKVSPELVMKLYRARPIRRSEADALHSLVESLTSRAALPSVPQLYMMPSPVLNAFAVGSPERASVAITHGMLQRLNLRELAGVLAHEVSHIRNNDLWIMGLADTFNRMTQMMAYVAIFLFIINLPLAVAGGPNIPWLALVLLYLAPTAGSLLQLGLSRAREFDADLEAAELTGDPEGLASALTKLEHDQGQLWEDVIFSGRRMPQPSLLRSHPPTDERVRRLLELKRPARRRISLPDLPRVAHFGAAPRHQSPRYHWPGVWY